MDSGMSTPMTTEVAPARAVEPVKPNESACSNCAAAMAPDQRFCGSCGQRVIHGRLTFPEIGHDFFHALTHADRSIFALIASLVLRPGRVARDYIAGRRKRYFGPFAFLVISVGMASFATYLVGVEWFAPVPHEAVRAFLARHFNLVILVQVPLIALFCLAFFRSARLNFSEHLVLAAYVSGFRALLLALIEVPMHYITGIQTPGLAMTVPYLVVWLSYFAFACVQFYGGNPWWASIRAVLAALLAQFVTSMLIFVVVFLSYSFGG
jgi:hypothetical protein